MSLIVYDEEFLISLFKIYYTYMIKKISVTIFFLITLLITGCVKGGSSVLNPSSTEVVMSNMQGTGTLNITSKFKMDSNIDIQLVHDFSFER